MPVCAAPAATTRRLPPDRVRLSPEPCAPARPGEEYRVTLAQLAALRLPRLTQDHLAHIAAILTLAAFLRRALWDFQRARNRANDVLSSTHRLLNTRIPWSAAAVAPLDAALAALQDDPVLTLLRVTADVKAGVWPQSFPLRDRLMDARALLTTPDPGQWHRLRVFATEFEDFAARNVGPTVSISVDIDGIGRFLMPAGLPTQGDHVVRWAAWAVGEFVEQAAGGWRGAGKLTGQVIDKKFPRSEPIDIDKTRHRAWKAYFGGKRRRVGTGDYRSSPSALWLARAGGYAAEFARLP